MKHYVVISLPIEGSRYASKLKPDATFKRALQFPTNLTGADNRAKNNIEFLKANHVPGHEPEVVIGIVVDLAIKNNCGVCASRARALLKTQAQATE